MSLWSSRKSSSRESGTEVTTVPCIELVIFGSMFGVAFLFLLVAPFALYAPEFTTLLIYCLFAAGLGLVLVAKVSVIRAGRLVSWGSTHMSRRMRICYRTGYALLGAGTAISLVCLKIWAAL